MLIGDWGIQIVHSHKKGNKYADWLANYSLTYELGMHQLENPPIDLSILFFGDVIGVTIPRVVCL